MEKSYHRLDEGEKEFCRGPVHLGDHRVFRPGMGCSCRETRHVLAESVISNVNDGTDVLQVSGLRVVELHRC